MFDIGFWELTLIAVVALLVVGPDRLPELARTTGLWVGKLRRMVAQVKDDVERELQAEELRRSLREAASIREAYEALEETRSSVDEVARDLSRDVADEPPARATGGGTERGVPADATADGLVDPTPLSGDEGGGAPSAGALPGTGGGGGTAAGARPGACGGADSGSGGGGSPAGGGEGEPDPHRAAPREHPTQSEGSDQSGEDPGGVRRVR